MKKLFLLALGLSLIAASESFGQDAIYNSEATTVIAGSNLEASRLATSNKGELYTTFSTSNQGSLLSAFGSSANTFFATTLGTDITTTASTQIKPAQANSRQWISTWGCTNTSAVATVANLLDGSTVLFKAYLPANGGFVVSFPTPIRGGTNTATNIQLDTTATVTRCSVVGFQNGW